MRRGENVREKEREWEREKEREWEREREESTDERGVALAGQGDQRDPSEMYGNYKAMRG